MTKHPNQGAVLLMALLVGLTGNQKWILERLQDTAAANWPHRLPYHCEGLSPPYTALDLAPCPVQGPRAVKRFLVTCQA